MSDAHIYVEDMDALECTEIKELSPPHTVQTFGKITAEVPKSVLDTHLVCDDHN